MSDAVEVADKIDPTNLAEHKAQKFRGFRWVSSPLATEKGGHRLIPAPCFFPSKGKLVCRALLGGLFHPGKFALRPDFAQGLDQPVDVTVGMDR